MKLVEDMFIERMQKCNNICGDKILQEAHAKECLIIAAELIIESLECHDDPNWWKELKKRLKNRNTAITF